MRACELASVVTEVNMAKKSIKTPISNAIVYQKMSGYVSNLNTILKKYNITPSQNIENILKQYSTSPIMPNEFKDSEAALNHLKSFMDRIDSQYLTDLKTRSSSTAQFKVADLNSDLQNLKAGTEKTLKSILKSDANGKQNINTENPNRRDQTIPIKKDFSQIINPLINPLKRAANSFFSIFKPIVNRIKSRIKTADMSASINQTTSPKNPKQESETKPDIHSKSAPEGNAKPSLETKTESKNPYQSDTFIPAPPPLPEEFFNTAVDAEEDAILNEHYAKMQEKQGNVSDTYIPAPPPLPEEFFNPAVEAEEDAVLKSAGNVDQTKSSRYSKDTPRTSAIPEQKTDHSSHSARLTSVDAHTRSHQSKSENKANSRASHSTLATPINAPDANPNPNPKNQPQSPSVQDNPDSPTTPTHRGP